MPLSGIRKGPGTTRRVRAAWAVLPAVTGACPPRVAEFSVTATRRPQGSRVWDQGLAVRV